MGNRPFSIGDKIHSKVKGIKIIVYSRYRGMQRDSNTYYRFIYEFIIYVLSDISENESFNEWC